MSNREQRFTLGLLAMEGSVLSSLIGPTDMFRIAQKLAQVRDPGTPLRLETVLVGARGLTHVNGSGGLQLSGVQSPDLSLDCLLIPGIILALFDRASGPALASRLSGLLIGEELRAQAPLLAATTPITVVGSPALALRYQRALQALGHGARRAPADAGWLGMLAVARAAGLVAAPGTLAG